MHGFVFFFFVKIINSIKKLLNFSPYLAPFLIARDALPVEFEAA